MPSSAHDIRRPLLARVLSRIQVMRDQYFLSRLLLVMGLLTSALLLFERILHDVSNALGASELAQTATFTGIQRVAAIGISLMALGGALHFIRAQRRELRQNHDARELVQLGVSDLQVVTSSSVGWRRVRDAVAVRTGLSAIGLYAAFFSLVASHSGAAALALGSVALVTQVVIIGYALLVGLLVALVSMVGVRTLLAIRALLERPAKSRVLRRFVAWRRRGHSDVRSYRDLFGSALLSRGPPTGRAAA